MYEITEILCSRVIKRILLESNVIPSYSGGASCYSFHCIRGANNHPSLQEQSSQLSRVSFPPLAGWLARPWQHYSSEKQPNWS